MLLGKSTVLLLTDSASSVYTRTHFTLTFFLSKSIVVVSHVGGIHVKKVNVHPKIRTKTKGLIKNKATLFFVFFFLP